MRCDEKSRECRGAVMNDIHPETGLPIQMCEHHLDWVYADAQDSEAELIWRVQHAMPDIDGGE